MAAMATVLLASCEKEINVPGIYADPQVVVMGSGEAEVPYGFSLVKSKPIYTHNYVLEDSDYDAVSGANASLTARGRTYSFTEADGHYTSSYIPAVGDTVSLSISVPGQPAALTSTSYVPQPGHVENLRAEIFQDPNWYASNSIGHPRLRFTIVDDGSRTDYYSLTVLVSDTLYRHNLSTGNTSIDYIDHDLAYFKCSDYQLISNSGSLGMVIEGDDEQAFDGQELYFTDGNIDGMRHNVVIEMPSVNVRKLDTVSNFVYDYRQGYTVQLHSHSRDNYLYHSTVDAALYGDGLLELISEPVQIHSNIAGGIGIFGFSTSTSAHTQIQQ